MVGQPAELTINGTYSGSVTFTGLMKGGTYYIAQVYRNNEGNYVPLNNANVTAYAVHFNNDGVATLSGDLTHADLIIGQLFL